MPRPGTGWPRPFVKTFKRDYVYVNETLERRPRPGRDSQSGFDDSTTSLPLTRSRISKCYVQPFELSGFLRAALSGAAGDGSLPGRVFNRRPSDEGG